MAEGPLSERLGDLLLAVCLPLISLIPRRVGLRLGEMVGRAIYLLDRRHRRIALVQLREALGDTPQVRALSRQVFENLGRLIMEMFYLRRLTGAEVRRRVSFEGLEHFWRALKKGRGCLILTAHLGAFELVPAALSLGYGRRVNAVVRRMDWGPAHRALVRLRERCGNRSVTKGRAMRQLIRLLEAGEVIGVLLDQNVTAREGVFVEFLGRPACTNKGLALLAMRTGAPVVPTFVIYEGRARHRVFLEPEVELVCTGNRQHDVRENTARFSAAIERFVRRYPGQWFWMHCRWKTRPPDEFKGRREEAEGGASPEAA